MSAATVEMTTLETINAKLGELDAERQRVEAGRSERRAKLDDIEAQLRGAARGDAGVYGALRIAATDAHTMIERADEALRQISDERREIEHQRDTVEQIIHEQRYRALAAAHVRDGSELDTLAEAFVARLETFFQNDIALDRAAQGLGRSRPSPVDARARFALSFHLTTPTVMRILGSTRVELGVDFSRHRGGLRFAQIAAHPAALQLDAEPSVVVGADGAVIEAEDAV